MSQSITPPRPNLLIELILVLLTPMFLCVSDGDIPRARQAAAETLNAYGARSLLGVVLAAKIIAYELAALASLSQSMADDISPQLALRFRGNANSLDRAADRNRQLLERQRIPAGAERYTEEQAATAVAEAQQRVQQAVASLRPAAQSVTRPAAQPEAQPATAPTPQPRMSDEQRRAAWADAMATVAAEFTADLDKLLPAERAKEMMRIRVLTESASALVAGITPPIGDSAD
ncbi:MAG: hypothetical protein ACJ8AW_14725 [Rhodopila sp.]